MMRQRRVPWTSVLCAAPLAFALGGGTGPAVVAEAATKTTALPSGSPAAVNGRLRVCRGRKLCNRHDKPIQLRGISSHGLQWYAQCLNRRAIKALARGWGADVIRLSLYVQEGGYEANPRKFTRRVNRLIERVTKRGLYVIVDWHILTPGDPFHNLDLAKVFFRKIARRHDDKTNILYEVANEPNGAEVTWARIKRYHEQIIPVIRAEDPDAVILLGTRGWSSLGVSDGADESEVVADPVRAENVMYTFHFYAASHKGTYRKALRRAARKIPMFVTEFGLQTYTGDGNNDFRESRKYIRLMRRKKIGWVYWNFSDDWRSGAALEPGTCAQGNFSGTDRLKPSGKWIRKRMRRADDFPG